MFGSKKRAENRRQEIKREVKRQLTSRTNIADAIREVLDSPSDLSLHVGKTSVNGGNGRCSISVNNKFGMASTNAYSDYTSLRKTFGAGYKMSIAFSGYRDRPHIGHILAPGWRDYSIPSEHLSLVFDSLKEYEAWLKTSDGRDTSDSDSFWIRVERQTSSSRRTRARASA